MKKLLLIIIIAVLMANLCSCAAKQEDEVSTPLLEQILAAIEDANYEQFQSCFLPEAYADKTAFKNGFEQVSLLYQGGPHSLVQEASNVKADGFFEKTLTYTGSYTLSTDYGDFQVLFKVRQDGKSQPLAGGFSITLL